MSAPSLTVCFALPAWTDDFVAEAPRAFPDETARMAFVIGAARRNIAAGTGGPFAAAVFETVSGKLVAPGVNLVTSQNLSMLHAEMVALALAQRRLGTYDLGRPDLPAMELVTSVEPCAMCLGAIPWAGIRRVLTGARDADAHRVGFDEGAKPRAWALALKSRGITVRRDLLRSEAAQVLRDYAAAGGPIYNAEDPRH